MRLPDFLVVGAMKAGTTSLCNDLATNPEVFFPSVKEPHTLIDRSFEKDSHYEEYSSLFDKCGEDQICGEGSTGYTKIHKFEGVPSRTNEVIGEKLKIIYIVRNPIERIKSHHYHLYRKGDAKENIDKEIFEIRDLIEVSKYGMQIKPWVKEFGVEKIRIVKFEEYIEDRKNTVKKLLKFLGLESKEVRIGEPKNKGENSLVPPQMNLVKSFLQSQIYKRKIHPKIPRRVLNIVKRKIYSKPPSRPSPPEKRTVKIIVNELRDDIEKISELAGYNEVLWTAEDMYEAASGS